MTNKINNDDSLTIGYLAKQAGISVETIRYYQSRDLLPIPKSNGGYRRYSITLVDKIRFIKRAQQLGFSLEEIHELLMLDEYNDKKMIQKITVEKIDHIQQKINDLVRMQTTLQSLLGKCKHSDEHQNCPIIASFTEPTIK